jgi:DNA polymerase elongation subunit (family B)
MRRVITIDIETLPAASDSADPKTALNGDFGRILCIGFADEDALGLAEGVIGWDPATETFPVDERATLAEFWSRMRGFRPSVDRVVGHNVYDFDLKFILKRSVILGVRPTVELSFARYRNQPIFDTMHEWERWSYGTKASLDTLAKALGLVSSKANGVDGSRVHELFVTGRHQDIRDYCAADVALTRAIYKKLTFADCALSTGTGVDDLAGASGVAAGYAYR